MKIDGNVLAAQVLEDLKNRVKELKKRGVTPQLAIVLVGDDPASQAYVRQKDLNGTKIGAKVAIHRLPITIRQDELIDLLSQLNRDQSVHGIIVQRPLPQHINPYIINQSTEPKKDIDNFSEASPYTFPIAAAVLYILRYVFESKGEGKVIDSEAHTRGDKGKNSDESFIQWLKSKNVVIIGKGETGGAPIRAALNELGVPQTIIDSKTSNPDEITKQADIVISAVGKPNVVKPEALKQGAILLGLGMYRGEDGKLHADYDEEKIKDVVAFYTPCPGGIGPTNVAMLLQNLLIAAEGN